MIIDKGGTVYSVSAKFRNRVQSIASVVLSMLLLLRAALHGYLHAPTQLFAVFLPVRRQPRQTGMKKQ